MSCLVHYVYLFKLSSLWRDLCSQSRGPLSTKALGSNEKGQTFCLRPKDPSLSLSPLSCKNLRFKILEILKYSIQGEKSVTKIDSFGGRIKTHKFIYFCWKSFCSRCYKTLFGGNLDFPKIEKLNKAFSNVWNFTKMWK